MSEGGHEPTGPQCGRPSLLSLRQRFPLRCKPGLDFAEIDGQYRTQHVVPHIGNRVARFVRQLQLVFVPEHEPPLQGKTAGENKREQHMVIAYGLK
ncbi:hypothetical protein D3C76_1444680 [compost metagenome]